MLKKISLFLTEILIVKQIINEDEKKRYTYGFELCFSTIISLISILMISILKKDFFFGILFLFIFMPLRMTANGYHAKTFSCCFLLTNSVFIIYLLLLNIYKYNLALNVTWVVLIASIICICLLAPVVHPNHKLSDTKKKQNRFYALTILGIDLLIVVFFAFQKHYKISYAISITIIIVASMMIIKNKQKEG